MRNLFRRCTARQSRHSLLSQVLHLRESDFRPEFLPRVIHTFTLMTLDDGAKISFHVVNQEEISPFPIYLNSTSGMHVYPPVTALLK